MNYALHLIIYFCIYAIAALSLNLVIGYCGLLTLAHAGYFAIGAYSYAILSIYGWGFLPALAGAVAIAAVLSLIVSLPAWRFHGNNFVLMSLAAQALIFSLLQNWYHPQANPGTIRNLTNGPFGLAGIPRPVIFGYRLDTIGSVSVLALILLAICGLVIWRLQSSPWGRLLQCMRDDELALRGLGKNVRRAKLEAFAVSSGLVAMAGVLYASYVSYIDASSATLDESILMVCMLLVGGMANFKGPLVGAAVLLTLPEILRMVNLPDAVAANVRVLAYGLLLVLIVHFRPQGLAGNYRVQ
ncbi:MAG: branched-chain amino acid ABC transporter permease [Verrucomicrobia bacterium]|nr:branched-chain amino acid ABC transporter permease [Verrucomicrobiota bacterium]MCH8510943.1 branched-chain amino acid ABC transporter permease [Kiritimatiellia bacterium]